MFTLKKLRDGDGLFSALIWKLFSIANEIYLFDACLAKFEVERFIRIKKNGRFLTIINDYWIQFSSKLLDIPEGTKDTDLSKHGTVQLRHRLAPGETGSERQPLDEF